MPINQLPSEILSGSYPELPIFEALVGDVVSFAPTQTFAAPTTTLPRKPAGSAASVVSNAITFDVAGRYDVQVAAGGFTKNCSVVVFPVATIGRTYSGPNGPTKVTRQHLRGLCGDPAMTAARITSSLEAATATTVGLTGSVGLDPAWSQYA